MTDLNKYVDRSGILLTKIALDEGCSKDKLMEYARLFHVDSIIRGYMEVLL